MLEFVQNADDNIYYPSVTPELTMDFDEDSGMLVVSTNEQGFKEKDVRSICDLGESTKKGSEDSIGMFLFICWSVPGLNKVAFPRTGEKGLGEYWQLFCLYRMV